MSGCELEQEGYCTHECEYGTIKKGDCSKEGPNGECLAKPEDMVDVCEFCLKPDCHNEECLDTTNAKDSSSNGENKK